MPVVDAPAKLTRRLKITGVRPDGYHLIDAEMVTLELCDRLTIDPDAEGLDVFGPFAEGVPLDGTNLVARALELLGRRARVRIDKHIPHGGGLGGGSADAAAVLRWAGFDDLVVASRLGADIPFCTVGGRARVRGIGEVVEPLPFVALDVTLIVPPLAVSTPAIYRAWDEMSGPTGAVNDLEPAAVAAVPALAVWRDRIAAVAGVEPTLAGSGATWFIEGHHPGVHVLAPEATVVLTRTRA
ncbi:MAG: 4-(cytidine 5'-diphospho)-2-C-methyl-D-erythritol kinase [Ilumatobacteraceae bacterium]